MNPWATVTVIGVGTYLIRVSFIGAVGSRRMPPWFGRALTHVGPAVLAALSIPAILLPDGTLDVTPAGNPQVVAAILAGLVAWRTRNIAVTFAAGIGTLWILQAML
jgi:branched-subunit amino acid transport protein